jgi:hypothetical protein
MPRWILPRIKGRLHKSRRLARILSAMRGIRKKSAALRDVAPILGAFQFGGWLAHAATTLCILIRDEPPFPAECVLRFAIGEEEAPWILKKELCDRNRSPWLPAHKLCAT